MCELVLKVGMIVVHSDGRRTRVEEFRYEQCGKRWYTVRDQYGSKEAVYGGLVELSSDQKGW